MPIFRYGASVKIGVQLEGGETNQYPQAKTYVAGALVDTINLTHVAGGYYEASWSPGSDAQTAIVFTIFTDSGHTVESLTYGRSVETWMPISIYTPKIADDVWDEALSGHTTAGTGGAEVHTAATLSIPSAATVADAVWDEAALDHISLGTTGFVLSELIPAEASIALIKKILMNKLELAEGDTANWVLYDDDDTTPLLTWDVSDKNSDPIEITAGAPAKRTRGV